MNKTTISWTDKTWNPADGCEKVSPGCDHCYAEALAHRFAGTKGFPNGFAVTLHPERLDQPRHMRAPKKIFVNSMGDVFHDQIPDGFIGSMWDVMAATPRHTFQVLTKRHGRMRSLLSRWQADGWTWRRHDGLWCGPAAGPLPNVWMGCSVEDQKRAELRIPALTATPAAVRFLSCEPLLGPVNLTPWLAAGGIHQVIVGGESGPGARPMDPQWVADLYEQCTRAGVAFWFKQAGNVLAKQWGCTDRKGENPDEWPVHYPQEFPTATTPAATLF